MGHSGWTPRDRERSGRVGEIKTEDRERSGRVGEIKTETESGVGGWVRLRQRQRAEWEGG